MFGISMKKGLHWASVVHGHCHINHLSAVNSQGYLGCGNCTGWSFSNIFSCLSNLAYVQDIHRTFVLFCYQIWRNILWKTGDCMKIRMPLHKLFHPIARLYYSIVFYTNFLPQGWLLSYMVSLSWSVYTIRFKISMKKR